MVQAKLQLQIMVIHVCKEDSFEVFVNGCFTDLISLPRSYLSVFFSSEQRVCCLLDWLMINTTWGKCDWSREFAVCWTG
jgi:hypothetical protein